MTDTVVLIDDSPAILKLLQDILRSDGYEIRAFSSGELALRSLTARAAALVLLDVRMPGMDGLAICRYIKADDRLKETPVIFLSATDDPQEKVMALQAGGVDFISKPFHEEEVRARVRTHLDLHR
ncbi:MAG TPA: response regulator, partial [Moraxellaceae bacterium]|nr:response regulator [Moraxellaceae bacterium]